MAWLAEKTGIPNERVMVVGNDFNDIHMLEWAVHSFVVDNAPWELKNRFEIVPGCAEAGFTAAVGIWMRRFDGGAGGRIP